MARARASNVAVAVVLGGCGPSIAVDNDGTTSTAGVEATTTSGAPATTSEPVPPTTPPDDPPGATSNAATSNGDDATTGDRTTSDDGCGFLASCYPDLGSDSCDLYAQDCPTGEKCMPWATRGPAWNATRCSPLAPDPKAVGEECMVEGSGVSGIDDCDAGLMCWNVDEMGLGVCEDMCTGSADAPLCENPQDICTVWNDGFIALCVATCHPLLQDCVIENETCFALDADWVCLPGWQSEGLGAECWYAYQCGYGNACVVASAYGESCDPAMYGCCTALCDVDDAKADTMCAALDPAQTCEPWYAENQAPPGYANVGACMIAEAP